MSILKRNIIELPMVLRLVLAIMTLLLAYCVATFLPRTKAEEEWNGDGLGPAGRLELMIQREPESPSNAIEHYKVALESSPWLL
jgi:hypothetical protein